PAGESGQSGGILEHLPRQDDWHARLDMAEREADRQRPGARQLLRSQQHGPADRPNRVADSRLGDSLPQYLCSRDRSGGSKIYAGENWRLRARTSARVVLRHKTSDPARDETFRLIFYQLVILCASLTAEIQPRWVGRKKDVQRACRREAGRDR